MTGAKPWAGLEWVGKRTGQLLINEINGRLMRLHGVRARLGTQNWAMPPAGRETGADVPPHPPQLHRDSRVTGSPSPLVCYPTLSPGPRRGSSSPIPGDIWQCLETFLS